MSSSEGTLTRERTHRPRVAHDGGVRNGTPRSRGAAASEAIRKARSEVASKMLGAADPVTSRHSDDVELLASELCKRFGIEGEDRETLLLAARLHDVGKVSIPQEVLDKRGPLDADDWKLIKNHTIVGERLLARVPELAPAAPLVRHSHENFDGSGYPDGLRGDEIPLGSRIIFCVDAFHAIRCDRPYRKGRSTEEALAEIKANAGSQFDPKVVKALTRSIAAVRRVRRRRVPRRVAVLFATLAIGSSGAYAAEQGWIPSPIPGLGPANSSDEGSGEAASTGGASASASYSPIPRGAPRAPGKVDGRRRDQINGVAGDKARGAAKDRGSLRRGGLGSGPGSAGGQGSAAAAGGASHGSSGSPSGAGGGATGGSAGQSNSTPGHGDSSSVDTDSASVQGGSSSGQGWAAGGQSGAAPGHTGSTPGQSGSTPGESGSNPGSGGAPPGQSGSAPGLSGSTPGQSGSNPGNSANAPPHNKP
jgi:HD domain-containing protein